jgi:hypothetical protein
MKIGASRGVVPAKAVIIIRVIVKNSPLTAVPIVNLDMAFSGIKLIIAK